ncbi:hypothetical protein TI10_09105 [Photorhabdus luminescens subsp. luminescens]|uniref:Uncharacterized protein n=1 Tax=Photorhabdus luminescens TaxID=29488 RepID=A0A1G5R772_PHOLU|nr:hypothetical protein TI10_09105 [Photorhabdus luminescens subsp. luminescens]SCZ69887.1 hypothetical protein SAMN02982990_03368 [Photorhabdus luminescens]
MNMNFHTKESEERGNVTIMKIYLEIGCFYLLEKMLIALLTWKSVLRFLHNKLFGSEMMDLLSYPAQSKDWAGY